MDKMAAQLQRLADNMDHFTKEAEKADTNLAGEDTRKFVERDPKYTDEQWQNYAEEEQYGPDHIDSGVKKSDIDEAMGLPPYGIGKQPGPGGWGTRSDGQGT